MNLSPTPIDPHPAPTASPTARRSTIGPRAEDSWRRWRSAWHVGYLLQLWGALVLSVASDPPLAIYGAVAALSCWYVIAWPRAEAQRARPWRYELVLWTTATGTFALSYFAGYFVGPTAFMIGPFLAWLPVRRAIGSVAVLGLAIGVRMIAALGWEGLLVGVGAAAISIVLGLFVHAIVKQSEARRALIDELDATRGQLAESERQRGAEAERSHLAREVHDTVVQDLISVLRLIESARRTMARSTSEADGYLELGEGAARDGLAEARRLVGATRSSPLAESNLTSAIERACQRFTAETGVPASLTVAAPLGGLPPDVEVALLRVAQEALANVRKHAAARSVAVTLTRIDRQVALDISDDGVGFAADAADPRAAAGFGLVSLRERIAALGGTVVIDSIVGAGTTVTAQLTTEPGAPPEPGERAS